MNSQQSASPTVARGASGKTGGRLAEISTPSIQHNRPNRQAPTSTMLAHALRYATNCGWPVLPVRGKDPATDHGHKDATTDPETIGALFAAAHGVTGVGARMGGALRLVAPEIDVKTGATVDTFYKVAGVRMGEYKTPTMRTGGGGWRMICYVPDDAAADYGDFHVAKGIEIKGDGGQVVLPPSVHPDTKARYAWVPGLEPWNVDVAPIPALLLDRIRARQKATAAAREAHSGQAGQYDAATVKSMLAALDPWAGDYPWWLSILMAVHSALGDDGLDLAEAWADGKPGEVAKKFATFDASGKTTIATLAYHARLAGWQPAAAADETDLPAAWRITADDWKACPTCAALHTDRYSDNSLVHHHNWCRRPACPVYRKVRARDALRPVFGWPGVQTETVPAADWRKWRKNADRRHGDKWRATPPLADGSRLALYSVDSGGLNLDDVLNMAVTAILENEARRRARRQALAFLNTLPSNEALDPVALARMKEALDLLASTPKGGNVSTPRAKRTAGAELEATPKTPRPHKVATLLVSKPWHRTAMLAVLNRLNIPWERRSYGGWRTEPLTDVQMLQVTTALAFAVPGARVLSGALEAGSYAELSTPWPEDLPHTEREAALYALRERVNLEQSLPLRR